MKSMHGSLAGSLGHRPLYGIEGVSYWRLYECMGNFAIEVASVELGIIPTLYACSTIALGL